MNKTIAFEIGTEELPALELYNVVNQIEDIFCDKQKVVFDYKEKQIFFGPRRIVVKITGVPEKIEASIEEHKGPKLDIAYKDNQPTNACIGFAKGKGLSVEDLEQRDSYVYAVKRIPELNVKDVLPELFSSLIKSIKWKKSQRWGSNNEEFARPIRWIFAMFGNEVFNVEFAGIKSSNESFGHRFLNPGPHKINSADELIDKLHEKNVIVSAEERENIIRKQIKEIESSSGLTAELPKSIMQEVVNLCEWPTCMVGQFEDHFLEVPKEIIVDAMLVHQRYFPLFDKQGNLTNKFIIISNGNPNCKETIIDGNQRVVAARLYDAKFFFEEDKKVKLESYVDKLDDVVFQEQLGNMKSKANRISALSKFIATKSGLNDNEIIDAGRAGLLAKADLVTGAVVEFTQVQGVMGSYYAESSGENKIVAQAIRQHYMPRFSGDAVPESNVGKCVACADKIDSLCGMFAVGQIPTGSSDPFALRRGTIGVISIMKDGLEFSLIDAINYSLDLYEKDGIKFNRNEVFEKIIDFVITRTKVSLKDEGVDHDTIEAVSSVKVEEPLVFIARSKALDSARKNNPKVFEDLATAFSRANNLRDEKLGIKYDVKLLENTEKKLIDAIELTKSNIDKFLSNESYNEALEELANLKGPIDSFFAEVMIMDEDKKIQENRLKCLNAFVGVFADIADFSKMAKTK